MFNKKIDIEELIGKEVVLTNGRGWSKHGGIWTVNNYDYSFAFRVADFCIGLVDIESEDISRKNKLGNIYLLNDNNTHGVRFCHGGKNIYCLGNNINPEYKSVNNYLEEIAQNNSRDNLL